MKKKIGLCVCNKVMNEWTIEGFPKQLTEEEAEEIVDVYRNNVNYENKITRLKNKIKKLKEETEWIKSEY